METTKQYLRVWGGYKKGLLTVQDIFQIRMFWYISKMFDLHSKNQLFTNYDHFKLEKRKASNLENKVRW